LTDEELAEEAVSGSERAFSRLVDRHQDRLVGYLSKSLRDRETARDLVQRTWLRAWRHLHRFDPERARFSAWIHTIADRLARNDVRDRSRNPETPFQRIREARDSEGDGRPLEWEDRSRSPDRIFRRRQIRSAINEAVEKLSPTLRPAFRLRLEEDLLLREIGDRLDIPTGTAKSRVHQGRKMVQSTLRAMLPWSRG
jgi:RNA polymerase sigma-70 factor (ECF subfamily)